MKRNEIIEGVAGPKNCWPGHRKVGTQPGTGKNKGKRVNDCEKIEEQELDEAFDKQQVYKAHEEMLAKNPQYAAEVAKLPPLIRGITPDVQKRNQMVWNEIAKTLQKYKAIPVQEELPGQTPGQEIGTVVGQPNSQGEVTVKKADGSTAMINQQLLQPGQQPNTFQMPTQAVAPGSKVIAGPVTQGTQAMENAELSAVLRIAGLK
jgi:hypothetical protein